MVVCDLQNCISASTDWLKPSYTGINTHVSSTTIERVTLFVSLTLALITVAGHLTSLERRLTLLESQKVNASQIEGRLARIETILERLNNE